MMMNAARPWQNRRNHIAISANCHRVPVSNIHAGRQQQHRARNNRTFGDVTDDYGLLFQHQTTRDIRLFAWASRHIAAVHIFSRRRSHNRAAVDEVLRQTHIRTAYTLAAAENRTWIVPSVPL